MTRNDSYAGLGMQEQDLPTTNLCVLRENCGRANTFAWFGNKTLRCSLERLTVLLIRKRGPGGEACRMHCLHVTSCS